MDFLKQPLEHESLSSRAVEILRLLADGLSDREISERLVLTINTVKWYNRQIYGILGVNSRTQAIARAHELQVFDADDDSPPPPKTVPLLPKHNLPAQATAFIGRNYEMTVIQDLLDSTRLLTLVGSPGTGKTRLALRVAEKMIARFKDGVYFISLAPINDPELVINAITSVVAVSEAKGQPLIETLKHNLGDRQILLVLDNFEHLLPAAPLISELLAAAPNLKVLATSREPLHLYGEQEYVVPPLALPDAEVVDLPSLANCESIALFRQQARTVQSDFEVTAENMLDVAKICVRLEGLPLAIELAAARIKLLTPQALIVRLDNRLNALTGSIRDLPPRQQTLRGTIDWSYNLLTDNEKLLFARLSVFRGGRSLEAVETICGPSLPIDPLEGVESLLHKSLLRTQEGKNGEPRFIMLETIQEYAEERLEVSCEAETIRRQHAEYFVTLAEQAEPHLRRAGFAYWMRQLEDEHHNLLVALEWLLSAGDTELGLRLVAALRDFWIMSDHFMEGRHWTQYALPKLENAPPLLWARVYTATAFLSFFSSDLDERWWGKQLLEEAVNFSRKADEPLVTAWALIILGAFSIGQPDEYVQALAVTEQGLRLFRDLQDKPGMAQALCIIGELARTNGDDERAVLVYEECLALVRETGEKRRESMTLGNLGFIATHQADFERAEQLFKGSLAKALEHEYDKHVIITALIPMAGVMAAKGELEQAVQLIGAAKSLLEPIGVGLQVGDQPEYDRNISLIRTQLDDATFDAAWAAGRTMTLEQAVALALG